MTRQDLVELISQQIVDRQIIENRFSGVMHVDIYCNSGGIRRVEVAPEPERTRYEEAIVDPASGRAWREG